MINRLVQAFSAVLAVVVFGCGPPAGAIPGYSILKGVNRVEVFRVGSEELPEGSTEKALGGYPILAMGKEQGASFASRLSKVLRSEGVIDNEYKCGLEPGVAFRLWNGDRAVEVLDCFKCNILWPYVVGPPDAATQHERKNFSRVRAELLALSKEAFPDDAEIQGLPEHGSE